MFGAARSPYLQPALRFGQAPAAAPPGFVPSDVVGAVMDGMRRTAGAIIQELRNLYGIRLDRNEETAWLTFQTAPVLVTAGSAGVRGIMQVGQEADFVATGIVAQVQASPQTFPPTLAPTSMRFSIVDGSTNRQFQRSPMPLGFLSVEQGGQSAGALPWFLPKPRIFSRNSNLIWLLDNVDAADTLTDIALFGYRIYDEDALDLTKAR